MIRSPTCLTAVLALLAGCYRIHVVEQHGMEMPPVQFSLRSLTYPSGLRILVERDNRTRLAGVFLVVGAGSTSDPAGKEGLAHYIEHLAFRSRPAGGPPLHTLLQSAGAFSANAETGFDLTVYYELGLASELRDLLQVEGARMLAPVVGVSDLVRATELDVVKNELRERNETGFIGEVLTDMQAAVFPKEHPYERPVIGTLQSLDSLRAADIDAFVETHYRPENMTLLILGDVDLETADRLVAESLSPRLLQAPLRVHIPERMPRAAPSVPSIPAAPAQLPHKTALVTAPEIWIAWSLPRSFDTDEYLLRFVANVAERRLSRVASDDEDIGSISMDIFPGVQASMLLCRIVLYRGVHPEKSRDRVLDELPRIWRLQSGFEESVEEIVFSGERRVATVEEVSDAQDLVKRGVKRATITHFAQDPTIYSRAVRELTTMRRKDVRDYAEPYVTRERSRAVLFVPHAGTLTTTVAKGEKLSGPTPRRDSGPASMQPGTTTGASRVDERLQSLVPDGERTTTQLSNGLSVILQRRPGLPLVSAGLLVPAVPANAEERAAAEVAWLVGGPDYLKNGAPDWFGGTIRKSQGRDYVVYSVEGPSGNAEILIATLAEYARSFNVEKGDWVEVRKHVVPYWKRLEQDPRIIAERRLIAALLPGSPYGGTPTSEELAGSSQDAANDWIRRTHLPRNLTLSVIGDFDLKEMAKFIDDSFGIWEDESSQTTKAARPAAPPSPSLRSPDATLLVTDRPGATQAEVDFACLFPDVNDGAGGARREVGKRVLQDRLSNLLREEMGATYGAQVDAVALRGGTAYLEVESAVDASKLAAVLAALKRSLGSIGTRPAAPEELAAAKLEQATAAAVAGMTNQGLVHRHLMRARMGYPLSGTGEAAELLAVSAEDVRAEFQACLSANPTLSIVGDEKTVRRAVQAGWQ